MAQPNTNANRLSVPGSTKGFIYRRIDTQKSNDISFDFRNVKFRRWAIDITDFFNISNTYGARSLVNDGNGNLFICMKNNTTGKSLYDQSYWFQLQYTNGSYISYQPDGFSVGEIYFPVSDNTDYQDLNMWSNPSDYESSYLNTIKFGNTSDSNIIQYNNNVIIGESFYGNTISDYFYNNTIGPSFNTNVIGSWFNGNLILDSFYENKIEYDFESNLTSNFYENTFGFNFYNNLTSPNFADNELKNSIGNNVFGANFTYNTLSSNNNNNYYGTNCSNNKFDLNFSSNTIGDSFVKNNFNGSFSSVDFSGFTSTNADVFQNEFPKEITVNQNNELVVKYIDQYNDVIILGISDLQPDQPAS